MKVLGVRSGGRTADPHGEVTRPPRVRATTLPLDARPAALDFVSPHERALGKQTARTHTRTSTLSRQAREHTRAGTQACKHARHSPTWLWADSLSSARLALPPSVRACVRVSV